MMVPYEQLYEEVLGVQLTPVDEFVRPSTLRHAAQNMKIAKHLGIPFMKAHKSDELIKHISSMKRDDDLDSLRREINYSIHSFNVIASRIDAIKSQGLTKETKKYYNGIKKNYIDKGVTAEDLRKCNEFISKEVLKAISTRKQQLK